MRSSADHMLMRINARRTSNQIRFTVIHRTATVGAVRFHVLPSEQRGRDKWRCLTHRLSVGRPPQPRGWRRARGPRRRIARRLRRRVGPASPLLQSAFQRTHSVRLRAEDPDPVYGLGGRISTAIGDRSCRRFPLGLDPTQPVITRSCSDALAPGRGRDLKRRRVSIFKLARTVSGACTWSVCRNMSVQQ